MYCLYYLKALIDTTLVKKCLICPRQFNLKPANPTKRFCCRKCASIFGALKSKKGETDIEKILRDILERLQRSIGIEFQSQQPVGNITIPDFIISPNVLLFADGEYWHGKPGAKRRDAKINARLVKLGYAVHRFTGQDLKNHRRKVSNVIRLAAAENSCF